MATKRQGKPSKVVAMSLALLLSSQAVVPYAYASEQEQGSKQIESASLSAAPEKSASEAVNLSEAPANLDLVRRPMLLRILALIKWPILL